MSDLKKNPMGAKEEKVTRVKDNRTEQLDEQQLMLLLAYHYIQAIQTHNQIPLQRKTSWCICAMHITCVLCLLLLYFFLHVAGSDNQNPSLHPGS